MIFVLQYLLLKFVSRYYENWVVKSWGYSQIERLLLLHRAVRCTCILGDNKGWKKIKVSQRPGETFGIVIWYKDDNHPLRLDRTPRSSSFFLLATQLSSTILHVHIAQPTTGPRCWFRGETRRLSLSLSLVIEDRTHVRREFRDSGQKETLMNRKLGHLFPVYLSKSLKKHIFPI